MAGGPEKIVLLIEGPDQAAVRSFTSGAAHDAYRTSTLARSRSLELCTAIEGDELPVLELWRRDGTS